MASGIHWLLETLKDGTIQWVSYHCSPTSSSWRFIFNGLTPPMISTPYLFFPSYSWASTIPPADTLASLASDSVFHLHTFPHPRHAS